MMDPGVPEYSTMRDANSTASEMLWVTNTTVLRRSRHKWNRLASRAARVCSSRAENGSSMRNTSESMARTRAMATRCFMPPDSRLGRWSANSANPTARRAESAVSRRVARGAPHESSANTTFSSTVSHGSRLYSWKTTPRSGPGPATSRPR